VYSNNAAAQDWRISNNGSSGQVNVTTIGIGGIGDLFFFSAETPDGVVTQYHLIVGKPLLFPEWALGWH